MPIFYRRLLCFFKNCPRKIVIADVVCIPATYAPGGCKTQWGTFVIILEFDTEFKNYNKCASLYLYCICGWHIQAAKEAKKEKAADHQKNAEGPAGGAVCGRSCYRKNTRKQVCA